MNDNLLTQECLRLVALCLLYEDYRDNWMIDWHQMNSCCLLQFNLQRDVTNLFSKGKEVVSKEWYTTNDDTYLWKYKMTIIFCIFLKNEVATRIALV